MNPQRYCFSCALYIKKKDISIHYDSELHKELQHFHNLLTFYMDRLLFVKTQMDEIKYNSYNTEKTEE